MWWLTSSMISCTIWHEVCWGRKGALSNKTTHTYACFWLSRQDQRQREGGVSHHVSCLAIVPGRCVSWTESPGPTEPSPSPRQYLLCRAEFIAWHLRHTNKENAEKTKHFLRTRMFRFVHDTSHYKMTVCCILTW